MKQNIRILSIGNSFSTDATTYLHSLSSGTEVEIETVNLYIGGCSLERHWNNILSNDKAYLKEVNGVSTENYVSIQEELQTGCWDYVTLQQASHESNDYGKYQPYLKDIYDYVRNATRAEIVIHQTWAYEDGSDKLIKLMGYKKRCEMFQDLKKAYELASKDTGMSRIIPCGWIFEQMLACGFTKIHRDTFHASIPDGRLILSSVWYEFFTGCSAVTTSFLPEGMSKEQGDYLKNKVHEFMEALKYSKE